MYVMNGPRQDNGVRRYFGFATRASRDGARRAVANNSAAWDAVKPDAIIDIEKGGYCSPIRGSNEACRALAEAVKKAPVSKQVITYQHAYIQGRQFELCDVHAEDPPEWIGALGRVNRGQHMGMCDACEREARRARSHQPGT